MNEIPQTEPPVPDPERQEQARRYARLRRRLMPVSLALGLAWALGLLLTGASVDLRRALADLTGNRYVLLTLYALIIGGGYTLLELPLSYYSGFILPHRFGLSNQSLSEWILDRLKSGLIGGVLGLVLLQIMYLVLDRWPDLWWVPMGFIYLLFGVILSMLAPVLIAPLFYKFVPLQEQHQDLAQRLEQLAQRAGIHVRGVYRIDMSRRTPAANAGLMGLGRSRRIVLGDTMLDRFEPDEIETIMAHEMAHQVHHDIPLGILVQSVLTFAGLWLASLALEWGVGAFDLNGVADPAGLPWLALVLGAFGLVTMPLSNAWSRWRERLADRYAIRLTGKPLAFAAALVRLADQNLSEIDPAPWVEFLLYSHPALNKRIHNARAAAQEPA